MIRSRRWRDGWIVVITLIAFLGIGRAQQGVNRANHAANSAKSAAHQAKSAFRAQQDGRRIGSSITCSSISAVIDAGRATLIASSRISPHQFELALEGLGLPPQRVRAKQAKVAADLYAQSIALKVQRASGVKGVVREDGTLNCAVLRRAAKIR